MAKQINTVLSLKDKISQPLVKVSKNVDKVTREMKKSQNQIEKWKNKSVKAMDNVIKKSVKVGAAIGAAVGAVAVKVGFEGMKELDEGAAKVKSIAGNSLELKKIQGELLKSSTKTGVAVNELAESQYSAISSGVKASESIDAAVQSTKLAKAGFTDSDSALKLMTSTMNTFGLEGKAAMEEISDKMLITQNLGVTTVQELSGSLGGVTPIAKAAGASIDDVLSSVASLTKGGQSTEMAVTNLKGIMTSVIKPSKEAADTAKQLGIDFSVSAIKSKGFANFLEEIKEKTGGNTEVMGKLFSNTRALNGVLALTSDEGMKSFNNTMEAMKNSTGATDEAYETMTNTVGFKLDKLKNTSKNIFTSMMNTQSGLIGEYIDKMETWVNNNEEKIQQWVQSIGEGVTKMVDFIKSVFNFIKEHEKAIKTILIFVGTMYAVIKVVTLAKTALTGLHTIGLLLNGTLVATPLGWIILLIGGVVAAGYALYRNWDLIKEKAGELWVGIKESFAPWGEFFSNLWEGIKAGFKAFINFIIRGLNLPIKALNKIKVDVPDWVPKIGGRTFGVNIPTIPEFAKGTSYSPAGYARIHEEGGEIRKLSSGETIIPADKSDRLLRDKSVGDGVKVDVKILGNVIGNQEFIDEVGSEVYTKVKLALENI